MAKGFYTRKLIQRLQDECDLDIPEGVQIHRTYAGYWQRAAGAWSWWISLGIYVVGSQFPISVLAKAPYLIASQGVFHKADIHIDPEYRKRRRAKGKGG